MKRHIPLNLEPLEGKALLSGLSYSITTNQSSYAPGQAVEMTFQETNVSDKAITVQEGPSIDGFDVLQGGRMVWRSNSGMNPMYIALDTLQPGQSLTLTATWNGVPANGSTPASGTFEVANALNQGATTTFAISSGASPTSPTAAAPANDPAPTDPVTSTSTPPPSGGNPTSPVAVNVTTDPAGHGGRATRMTIRLTDVGNAPVTLPANAGAQFTLIEGSAPVWHRATSAAAVRHRTIRPGQSVELSVVRKGNAHAAGAGSYTLDASLGAYAGSTTVQLSV